MARVVIARPALDHLDSIVATHGLPLSARARVKAALGLLAEFPMLGRRLGGEWTGCRVMIGPWPWLLVVYRYAEDDDLVRVLAFHDARTSTGAAVVAAGGTRRRRRIVTEPEWLEEDWRDDP